MTNFLRSNLAKANSESSELWHTEKKYSDLMQSVLVVEDEAITALDLSVDLENWGYRVVGIATTMATALDVANQEHPVIAIIDVALRDDENGLLIAHTLQEKFGTHIVFLTAHSDAQTRSGMLSIKPAACLFKPYSAKILHDMLSLINQDNSWPLNRFQRQTGLPRST